MLKKIYCTIFLCGYLLQIYSSDDKKTSFKFSVTNNLTKSSSQDDKRTGEQLFKQHQDRGFNETGQICLTVVEIILHGNGYDKHLIYFKGYDKRECIVAGIEDL